MYHANSGTTTDIILFFKWKKIDLKDLVFCRERNSNPGLSKVMSKAMASEK